MPVCGAGIAPGARRVMARFLGAVVLALAASVSPASADFQAGAEAYARGDYKTAIDEWLPYAANGDPRALFNLGQMYRLGIGADKDMVKAEQYYRRAAELGHVGAQANLGSMLYDRKPPQGKEAVIFWRQAARGGDAKAQFLVGMQYFNGDFITRDHVQGYAWLSLAAKAGVSEAADALATVKTRMEPTAIDEATRLAATLVVSRPAPVAAPPTMQARLPEDLAAQLDGAVLRHPVEDLTKGLSPVSPDSVSGAIPIPLPAMDDDVRPPVQAASPEGPVTAPARPPSADMAADGRDVEYRAQFSTFGTEAEARELRRVLLDDHAKSLGGAAIEVEQMLSAGAQAVAYRVRTAPLKGEAAAKSICARLEPGGIPCQPARAVKIPVSVKSAPEAAPVQAPKPLPVPAPPKQAVVAPPAEPPVAAPVPPDDSGEEPGPRAAHPGDTWRVQVGAGRTEEEARFRWSRLMGSNADLLDAAELYIFKADLGARGIFYRVQIGGFATRPAAIGLCERLKARKVDCFVTATRQ